MYSSVKTGHPDNRISSCWSYVSNDLSSKLQTVYMSMCPAAFHITVIDLVTPAYCWSQHSSGVMTPFSHFFFFQSWNICSGFSRSAPARFWVFKIMRTPIGNLLFVGIDSDFLQFGDSSQYKKKNSNWEGKATLASAALNHGRQHKKNPQQTCQVSLIWGTTKLMLPSLMSVVS